ncbi:MAG: aldo/keto reductase [Acidobacteria bacterium]|nr:aldo/keto reductase [Acidobacteriota bacterium]
MPTRLFGQTGKRISIVAFGCGSRYLAYKNEDDAIAVVHKAMDLGINYFDTAYDYGAGLSETRIGKAIAGRRKDIYLATKLPARNGDAAQRILEGSLKRCQTDHFNTVHVHALNNEEDLAAIEAKDGVLNMLYKMRDQKVVHNVGISCHTDPKVLKTALERHDFNVTQFALNAARVGQAANDGNPATDSFEALALPVALKKKMGVTAMKIFAQEKLNGKTSVDNLIRYSLSQPVGAVVLGMPKVEFLEQNVAIAKAYQPMSPAEMKGLNNQLNQYKVSIDSFFLDHVDA